MRAREFAAHSAHTTAAAADARDGEWVTAARAPACVRSRGPRLRGGRGRGGIGEARWGGLHAHRRLCPHRDARHVDETPTPLRCWRCTAAAATAAGGDAVGEGARLCRRCLPSPRRRRRRMGNELCWCRCWAWRGAARARCDVADGRPRRGARAGRHGHPPTLQSRQADRVSPSRDRRRAPPTGASTATRPVVQTRAFLLCRVSGPVCCRKTRGTGWRRAMLTGREARHRRKGATCNSAYAPATPPIQRHHLEAVCTITPVSFARQRQPCRSDSPAGDGGCHDSLQALDEARAPSLISTASCGSPPGGLSSQLEGWRAYHAFNSCSDSYWAARRPPRAPLAVRSAARLCKPPRRAVPCGGGCETELSSEGGRETAQDSG
eukprot:360702-Chlamydomonas_euryale.AAC.3